MRYVALIFDLDGVLVDSEPLHIKSVEIVLARRGIQLSAEQAAQQTGITIDRFIDKIVKEWGLPGPRPGEDWIAEKRALFYDLAETQLEPVAGVEDLLRALDGKIKIGLASSSSRRYINWCVRRFGWERIFDVITAVDDVRQPKPDPEMYRLTVERLGVAGRPVLVFEDSPVGIQSAVAAGLDCAAVATSFPAEKLRAAGAKWVLRDFTDSTALNEVLK